MKQIIIDLRLFSHKDSFLSVEKFRFQPSSLIIRQSKNILSIYNTVIILHHRQHPALDFNSLPDIRVKPSGGDDMYSGHMYNLSSPPKGLNFNVGM